MLTHLQRVKAISNESRPYQMSVCSKRSVTAPCKKGFNRAPDKQMSEQLGLVPSSISKRTLFAEQSTGIKFLISL